MVENTFFLDRLDETSVSVHITVPSAKVNEALEKAREEVEELKKRPLGEKQLGKDPAGTTLRAIANRATRAVVEDSVRDAVATGGVRLTANPEIDLPDTVEHGKDFSFSFTAQVVPELAIEPFDRLCVEIDASEIVSAADVDAKLDEIRMRSAEVSKGSDQPIGEHDLVKLSFTSAIDGEAYEGGDVSGLGYQMGSLMMPAQFEDGLLGMRAGESRMVEFTVDADFENPEIAGRRASFDITVDEVAKVEPPVLDDDFARGFDYRDLAHFREVLAERVAQERSAELGQLREKRAREELAKRLVGNVPEALASAQALRMLETFKLQMKQQGVEFSEYCGYLGIGEQDVLEEMRAQAADDVRENLALEALFRHLGLAVSEADRRKTYEEAVLDGGLSADALYVDMNQDQKAAIDEMTEHRLATDWLLEHCDFVAGKAA